MFCGNAKEKKTPPNQAVFFLCAERIDNPHCVASFGRKNSN